MASFVSYFFSLSTSRLPDPKGSTSSKMVAPVPAILLPSPSAGQLHLRGPCLSFGRPPLRQTLTSKTCLLCHRTRTFTGKKTETRLRCSQVQVQNDIDDEACELVNGLEVVIGEGTDSIRAYLLKAVKNNNGTGILLLSDIFGFEDSSTRDFAYRVACSGYNVLVPDLFRGDPWKQDSPRTELEHWLTRQSPERVAKDIAISTKWMADEFVAARIPKKLGIIGFCYGGGRLIETLAEDGNEHFGIGVSFYGTRIDASLASKIKVPILFVSGDDDHLCPVNVLRDMEKSIKDSRVLIYSGRGHGFAHRPKSSEEDEDAEDAFIIMRNWLHDGLVAVNN